MGCGLFRGLTPVATHAHANVPNHRSWFHLKGADVKSSATNGPGLLRHCECEYPPNHGFFYPQTDTLLEGLERL